MTSTFSPNLAIELPARGDYTGTWDTPVNNNLGTLIESAICGGTTVSYNSDADVTVVITNGADSSGRYFELTLAGAGTLTATRNLIVPTVKKNYLVYNNTLGGQSIVVKTAAGSGVTVPNGARQLVYADGTNVVDQLSNVSALTIAGAAVITASSVTTLTNKTLDSSSNTLKIGGNPVTGSGAGTITIPADVLVGRTTTDTLTNKTLTSPTITGGTSTSLALTSPTGVVTTQAFSAGSNITLTGNLTNTSSGTLTIAGNAGTVTGVTLAAGSGIALSGTNPITGTGTVTVAATGGTGTVTSANFAAGANITLTGTNPITSSGTLTIAASSGGGGTVTSAALSMPAEFSTSGSPITGSGTFTVTKATQTANKVWAGPTSGGASAPTFRALVTGDMPSGTSNGTFGATDGSQAVFSIVVANGLITRVVYGNISGGSSPTTCFPWYAMVEMADGFFKRIVELRIGDKVKGAYGEINAITALDPTTLGSRLMFCINGEHWTSDEHSHMRPDRTFVAPNPNSTYAEFGKAHPTVGKDGRITPQMFTGLPEGLVTQMRRGQMLLTADGPKQIETLEIGNSEEWPPDTLLFGPIADGSGTCRIDGYVVSARFNKERWDHHTWQPK